jgi:hypothetical protein
MDSDGFKIFYFGLFQYFFGKTSCQSLMRYIQHPLLTGTSAKSTSTVARGSLTALRNGNLLLMQKTASVMQQKHANRPGFCNTSKEH